MRRRQPQPPLYERPEIAGDLVALTFDDGPAEWTVPILDKLQDSSVRATFFVIGDCIPGRESILKRTHGDGHEIGNHGCTHRKLDMLERGEIHNELIVTNERVESVIGVRPRLFRPPYFSFNDDVLATAAECGFERTVNASVFVNDGALENSDEIVEGILPHVKRGSIIDLHDGRPPHDPPRPPSSTRNDRLPTIAAVHAIVDALLEGGFTFVTVSELLASAKR